MRQVGAVLSAMLSLLAISSCGYLPTDNAGTQASASRTASASPVASPSLTAVFAPGSCIDQPPASVTSGTTKPLGQDSIVLKIPTAWTDHSSDIPTALLYVLAPNSYGSDHASFMLESLPFVHQASSSHQQAMEDASGLAGIGPQTPIYDCTSGGEQASFYSYQDSSGNDVYRLSLLHNPTSYYPKLYRVTISSSGRLDLSASSDVRAILGSWTWGQPTYINQPPPTA